MHHGLLTLLRDEQGRFVGYFPVFRSAMMKPFSSDDIAFFEAAAAHIGYGVSIAGSISSEGTDDSTFEPFQQVPQGVVVMDRAGKVLSLNRSAYSLFFNFAHYNDLDIKAFTSAAGADSQFHRARSTPSSERYYWLNCWQIHADEVLLRCDERTF